jgi:hypothetical protein
MQQLKKMYRADYTGEEILVNSTYRNSIWEYDYETVPNRVTNLQISNQACVIGNGESRAGFDLFLLANHRAGLGGVKAMQTYGCNALYRGFVPNFLVVTGREMIDEVAQSRYCDNNIVYANAKALLKHPSRFYLIPQDLQYNAGAIATFIACFDGHKKVFLLGFDNGAGANVNNNIFAGTACYGPKDQNYDDAFFVKSMEMIMRTYNDVEFIRVMPIKVWRTPPEWQRLANFSQIDFKEWTYMSDL